MVLEYKVDFIDGSHTITHHIKINEGSARVVKGVKGNTYIAFDFNHTFATNFGWELNGDKLQIYDDRLTKQSIELLNKII